MTRQDAENNRRRVDCSSAHTDNMEYAWLEPRHDPIATDTNLAEIDFENFKNEDLAFAFSCGEEESGGSSTDMSICRSEALFSSMRDSVGGAEGAVQDSVCQDSLLNEGSDFNFSEQVKVNKNNYTLTYSGQGAMGSFIASMVASGILGQNSDENNGLDPPPGESGSPGKLITWYNLSKQHQPIIRSRFREENTLNNNNSSISKDDSRKSKSLPDFGIEGDARLNRIIVDDDVIGGTDVTAAQVPATISEVKLVNAFFRGRRTPEQKQQQNDEAEMSSRSKDAATSPYLKAPLRLTSIEEVIVEGSSSTSSGSSGSSGQGNGAGSSSGESEAVRNTHGRQNASSSTPNEKYPSIDFLENDVSLWDAFFLRSKIAGRFQSVLRPSAPQPPSTVPPLPVGEYLRSTKKKTRPVEDADSLRLLLPQAHKHLLPGSTSNSTTTSTTSTPVLQTAGSLSKLNLKTPVDVAEVGTKQKLPFGVREAWPETSATSPGSGPGVVRRRRPSRRSSSAHSSEQQQRNLNALNNNNDSGDFESEDLAAKRRSYHPQDYLSKLLSRSSNRSRKSDFPKSGSQNDLCDTWTDDDQTEDASSKPSTPVRGRGTFKNVSAEYPFQRNFCIPQQGVNFDLTHKRGLFVALYSAVERLLMYQDSDSGVSARMVLFQELCPALHAIMEDGLKPEVITSFGRMETSVWRVVEAVTRQGGPNAGTTVCDLVMLLNTKFAASGEDHRKFAGFIAGLINMSTLHVWYTKLKWSMDVLLRFYERHAFICALHKETKLLFDELIYCLQRLYSLNCQIDLPFTSDLLDDIPILVTSPKHQCRGCVCGSGASSASTSHTASTTTSVATNTMSGSGGRKGSLTPNGSKSRIPRPISLPKRLEAKLGKSPSPVRSSRSSRPSTACDMRSPTKQPLTPASATTRKSRVRDTIKLFDSKSGSPCVAKTAANTASGLPPTTGVRTKTGSTSRKGKSGIVTQPLKSPKTGAGEAMALDSSGEQAIK